MRRLLLIGLLLLGACSSPKPAADADLGAVADQAAADSRGADLTASPDLLAMNDLRTVDLLMTPDFGPDYPAGPYGAMVGDTLTPMVWEGYVNPSAAGLASAQPYGAYTSDDLRRSGKRYALLYTSDYL